MHLKGNAIANLITCLSPRTIYPRPRCLFVVSKHPPGELEDDFLQPEWRLKAYPMLIKLSHALRYVNQMDGRLMDINNNSIIADANVAGEMQRFKSLAKTFIESPSMEFSLKRDSSSTPQLASHSSFVRQSGGNSMMLDSLTKICNFLDISAQQRQSVRLAICPQVTQQHVWRGALEQVLQDLKSEMIIFTNHSPAFRMGEQIVSRCSQFLADTASSPNQKTPLWMQLESTKKVDESQRLCKWREVREMLEDLSKCLGKEESFTCHLSKLEVMKEGLSHIKDVFLDREIGYRDARRQDSLVKKKLTKGLGHSSKCLFTLLLYYLFGSVRDIEVEICQLFRSGGKNEKFCVSVGKILTFDDLRMMQSGVKQLDKALGVFKFVWEAAGMKSRLELEGHLWCLDSEERDLMYRGNMYHVHGLRL